MKIVQTLVLALIAIIVIGLGAVFLLLPGQKEARTTVQIDRPVSSVFALLASTPPNQVFGTGLSQTVTGFNHPTRVEADVNFGSGKKAKASYELGPGGAGATVVATVTQNFGMNPFARLQGMSGEQLKPIADAMAANLRAEAQKLPTADFSDLAYEVTTAAPSPWIYLEAQTEQREDQIKEGIRQSMGILSTAFEQNKLQVAGRPIAVETRGNAQEYNFKFGIPYTGPNPGLLIGVKKGETPSGNVIKAMYYGPEATVIQDVYDKVDALIAATRLTEVGLYWEVYNDDPSQAGGSRNREIYYLIDGDTKLLPKIAPSAPAPSAPIATQLPAPAPAQTPATGQAAETPASTQ